MALPNGRYYPTEAASRGGRSSLTRSMRVQFPPVPQLSYLPWWQVGSPYRPSHGRVICRGSSGTRCETTRTKVLRQGARGSINRGKKNVKKIIGIEKLAAQLGMEKQSKTLPNGKVITAFEYVPAQLSAFFKAVEAERGELGREDVVTFDGGCPGWLLVCLSHAAHPANVEVKYPQGGPECELAVTGYQAQSVGSADGVEFKVTEGTEFTQVDFALTNPTLDLPKALQTLVAPVVPAGKPVRISGRGPIAILAALASAYAHTVPYVAAFQPGTGNVVAISHSDVALGTVLK